MYVFRNRLTLTVSFALLLTFARGATSPAHAQNANPLEQLRSAIVTMSAHVPYVDKYGQKITPDWHGKITSDDQLKQEAISESIRLKSWDTDSANDDRYGGNKKAGWKLAPTGYYRTVKYGGVWWLITPTGLPCFYKGLDNAPALKWETTPVTGRVPLFADLPPKDGPLAAAWNGDPWGTDPGIDTFAFCTANLIRKYGPDWQNQFRTVTKSRLKAWGFTGTGKWGDFLSGVPTLPDLNRTGVPIPEGGGHPDPFDVATQVKLKDILSAQITPHLTDPDVVAWSVGNEGAEIISTDEIEGLLVGTGTIAAKRAMVDYAIDTIYHGNVAAVASAWGDSIDTPPSRQALYAFVPSYMPETDLESLREFYADRYYALIEKTVKEIDPHHLYAGFWIVEGLFTDQPDWDLIAKNCDIIGFDCYDVDFDSHDVAKLLASAGKPAICGEFSFPQSENDRGFSDFGTLSLRNETESGAAYNRYVTDAATNRYCIGVCWFQYRDEPVTGRGPGYGSQVIYGENYPFGLVDITDQPKWTLLTAVHNTNSTTDKARLGLK